ncbi:MAG: Ig-like domain-containing protein, partial [Elusimicrobiota bacterium]
GSANFSASASSMATQVQFYVDNVLKNTDYGSPYSWSWNTTTYLNGTHTLKVIAVDSSSQTATDQISVTVLNSSGTVDNSSGTIDNLPTVAILTPANGATGSGNIYIAATASDDIGIIQVAIYIDDVLKKTYYGLNITSAPYSYSWNTTAYSNAAHTLKVIAVDSSSQTATAQINVTVSNNYTIISSTPTDIGISAEISPTKTVINPEKGQETKINFEVGGTTTTTQSGGIVHVTIAIYNARGELVKTLIDQDMPVGGYQAMWNGRNFEEDIVASGVYIVRLRAGNSSASKKIVVIK